MLDTLFSAIATEFFRRITGKLFTEEQIEKVTSNAVGKYFSDLFPEPEREKVTRERVEEARNNIVKASVIICEMQEELTAQGTQLDKLLTEIKEKKNLVEHYTTLATMTTAQSSALREEMEKTIRSELIGQNERGKGLRQFVSAVFWLLTLVLGAGLGTYFKEIVVWLKTLVGA